MRLRKSLFWDTDTRNIDVKKNAQYVIERVLELGNDREVRWMWKFYGKEILRDVIKKSRSLNPETKNLWELLLKNR
ncbi:hypothetical protein HY227_00400 [Candidatus Wolfebacteria bacterium]|nr:hypothetical protein [Candidatus Wolfebacteria bacterium]